MEWQQIEQLWNETKWKVKSRWEKLTSEDLSQIDGSKERLCDKLELLYGLSHERADREIQKFTINCHF